MSHAATVGSYFRSTSMLIVRIYLQAHVPAKPGNKGD